jgi:hypothetical protein
MSAVSVSLAGLRPFSRIVWLAAAIVARPIASMAAPNRLLAS